MKRIRGRRVALLLASALPLLAENDVPATAQLHAHHHSRNLTVNDYDVDDRGTALLQQQHAQHDVYVSSLLPTLSHQDDYDDWALHLTRTAAVDFKNQNVIIPFRPPLLPPWKLSKLEGVETVPRRKGGRRVKCSNETIQPERESKMDITTSSSTDEEKEETQQESSSSTVAADSEEVQQQQDAAVVVNETTTTKDASPEKEEEETVDKKAERLAVDYASKSAGALILEKSPNFDGTSNLLTNDKDRYAIVPCQQEEPKFVVIGLSEDILVKQVILANYERYSSQFSEFNLQGSTRSHKSHWIDMGTFSSSEEMLAGVNRRQTFDVEKPTWARYLKFRFLRHDGDEHYCTLSQISVFGSTMLQGFHEQWEEDEEEQEEGQQQQQQQQQAEVEQVVNSRQGGHLEAEGDEDAKEPSQTLKSSLPDDSTECSRKDNNNKDPTQSRTPLEQSASCFNEIMDFERAMFLFRSSAANESDSMNNTTLAAASFCLSSSQPVNLDYTITSSSRRLQQLNGSKAMRRPPNEKGSTSNMIADRSKETDEASPNQQNRLTESPLIKRIQKLIKSTAGVDVKLVGIGRVLSRSADSEARHAAESIESKVSSAQSGETISDRTTKDEDATVEELSSTAAEDTHTAESISEHHAESTPSPSAEMHSTTAEEASRETNVILSKLLKRFPSASCLEGLDFSTFKANHVKTRSSGPGNAGNAPTGHAMEPIFKKLADEIKTLQANVAMHDQFAKESVACYQRIVMELLIEMEAVRLEQDDRISRIEKDLNSGFIQWIDSIRTSLTPFVSAFLSWLLLLMKLALLKDFGAFVSFIRLTLTASISVLLCHLMGQRVSSRRPPAQNKGNSVPSNVNSGERYFNSSSDTSADSSSGADYEINSATQQKEMVDSPDSVPSLR